MKKINLGRIRSAGVVGWKACIHTGSIKSKIGNNVKKGLLSALFNCCNNLSRKDPFWPQLNIVTMTQLAHSATVSIAR
jgi:hypothetical protein